jgi:hypothetical protein
VREAFHSAERSSDEVAVVALRRLLLTSEASQQVFFPKFLQGAVAERSEATRRNKKWQTGGSADPGEVNGLLREELEG